MFSRSDTELIPRSPWWVLLTFTLHNHESLLRRHFKVCEWGYIAILLISIFFRLVVDWELTREWGSPRSCHHIVPALLISDCTRQLIVVTSRVAPFLPIIVEETIFFFHILPFKRQEAVLTFELLVEDFWLDVFVARRLNEDIVFTRAGLIYKAKVYCRQLVLL